MSNWGEKEKERWGDDRDYCSSLGIDMKMEDIFDILRYLK